MSYRLPDFIPFSQDTYEAVLSHYNASIWPSQIVCLLAVCATLFCILRKAERSKFILGSVLGLVWLWTGWQFLANQLVPLLPQARIFVGLFVVQAVLLLIGMSSFRFMQIQPTKTRCWWIGFTILVGSAVVPLQVVMGYPLSTVMLWGWGPDNTALGTLGLLLMTKGHMTRWTLAIIPILWLLATGLLQAGLMMK